MRDAARALDDVSDHLGEVLRRADELLVEWSRLGVQVRAQVEREVATIGEVVDGAVARAASSGIDRAIADRLRALTMELERLEQRTRAASRAVLEQREGDRRVLWIVVAGVVLANALLVVLLLRKPDAAPAAEPIRIESQAAPTAPADPAQAPSSGSAAASPAGSAGSAADLPASTLPAGGSGAPAPSAGSNATAPNAGSNLTAPNAGSNAARPASGSNAARPASGASGNTPAKATPPPHSPRSTSPGRPASDAAGPQRLTPSPIALPPRSNARGHKKQP